jgi:Tol biopolymer transport system component
MTTGPRDRNNYSLGGNPASNSCASSIRRLDLLTGKSRTVLVFPHSVRVSDAVADPSGRRLVLKEGQCDRAYFNEHLLVRDLRSGQQWTIGAAAPPCHALRTPSWSSDGSKLVFAYGAANTS